MEQLIRSRQKRVKKSGNLRMLYTPQESLDLEGKDVILPEPHSKRIRLSSTSCTATIGDGSHIDSSFDVGITPGVSRTQTQSYLNKSIFVSGRNLKVVPRPMQQHRTACDLFNNNNMESSSQISGSSDTHADGQNAVNVVDKNMFGRSLSKSPSVSGITRLQTTAHNKLAQLVQISSHRAEQAASAHKPQHLNEEEKELPTTQPVSSLLLKGQYIIIIIIIIII
jgi:hypothetical protein